MAVSDIFQEYSSPLKNYQRIGRQADEYFFVGLVQEYEVVGLVVGLPVHMSGDESEKSREARRYAKWLSRLTDLPVAFQDERYSSVMAESMLMQADFTRKQRMARIDKLAAQILLQNFMDSRSIPKPPPV
ncbi:MAG: Holliday junction resolvase RuvX [Planctomycetaceae bacterium]